MNALKTLPAALVAALGVIIAQGADRLPPWLLVVCAALAAGAAVYATPPGIGLRTPKPGVHKGQAGYVSQGAGVLGVGLVTVVCGAILHLGVIVALGIAACVAGLVLIGCGGDVNDFWTGYGVGVASVVVGVVAFCIIGMVVADITHMRHGLGKFTDHECINLTYPSDDPDGGWVRHEHYWPDFMPWWLIRKLHPWRVRRCEASDTYAPLPDGG